MSDKLKLPIAILFFVRENLVIFYYFWKIYNYTFYTLCEALLYYNKEIIQTIIHI